MFRKAILISVTASVLVAVSVYYLTSDQAAANDSNAAEPGRIADHLPGAVHALALDDGHSHGAIRLTAAEEEIPLQKFTPGNALPIRRPVELSVTDQPAPTTQLTAAEEDEKPSSRRRDMAAPGGASSVAGLPPALQAALSAMENGETPPAAAPKQLEQPTEPAAMPQPSSRRFNPAAAAPEATPSVTPPAATSGSRFSPDVPAAPAPISRWNSGAAETAQPAPIQEAPAASSPGPMRFDGGQDDQPAATPNPTAGSLLTVASPSVAVETIGPKSMVVGKPSVFQVVAKNLGKVDARDVAIKIQTPHGVELVNQRAAMGTAQANTMGGASNFIVWQMPVLPAGAEGTLNLELATRNNRGFDLGVDVAFSAASASTTVNVLEPKLNMAIQGPSEVLFGETQIYSIVITNPGSGVAENVGITLMPLKAGQDPTTFDQIGSIQPGGKKVIEVEFAARQAGELKISAEAFAEGGLRAQATEAVTVRRANLQLVANGPPVKYAATSASYLLNVSNNGNAQAAGVVAEATLPTGAKFESCSDGGKYDAVGNKVVWNIGALEAQAVRPLKLDCTLMVGGNNTILANCKSSDGLLASQNVTTMVESVADLKLYVNDPKGPAPVGEEVTYEFRLENRGTKAAEGIEVTVQFSQGIEPTQVSGGQANIDAGQVIFSPIQSLGPEKNLVLKVSAKALTAGSHSFRAEVRCREPVTKLASEETTRFYGEGVLSQPSNPQPTPLKTPLMEAQRPAEPTPLSPTPYSRFR
ncbi:DUF11 domain-containing protein [Blastopirellula sp. JC732]|uniref:DUF11 domain-containing protein n=1 Tax=Blastopirellula sediminis TaxID=2894196 RepID=A0A9X1MUW7_9BACT|nr:DUF11 domain-containing protein [Blastopirellula sediminis]MCC9604642.1 DUF11 domain-containing protein [Blastopirellula sediminis]MCC9632059.1 DUF11 domain-containing protein [Blastopirellula sediminis]